VGFIGAVLLILAGNGTVHATSAVFPAYVVAATVCYAISVNVLRHKLAGLHPLTITSFALLFIGVPMGAYLFSTDFIERTLQGMQGAGTDFPLRIFPGDGSNTSVAALLSVFVLGVVGTAISTVLFNRLIQLSGALVASSVTYLIPVVAAFWGSVFGEQIGWMHLAGLGLVLSGVYLISGRK
jgi:drug/metabolite transporter (DMT)-like permease